MNTIQLEAITKEQWIKNWSGNWRTGFASLYHVYTKGLQSYIGKNLDINLLVCETGVSSNYVAKKDLDAYGKFTASLITNDKTVAIRWSEDTVSTADDLFEILGLLEEKQNLNLSNLVELQKRFYQHIPPHFSMKKAVDYLSLELQEQLTPRLTEARLKTENLFNAVDAALRAYAHMIAESNGYEKEIAEFLTIEEIQKFLENKELPSKEELQIRSKGLIIFCQGDMYSLLSDSDFEAVQKHLAGDVVDQLKGTSAFKGVAQGTVRIVFDPFKVQEFNEGDVLVTGMTRPEFLPLMQKASAFVTDAGGVLSHAAIVARELAKPCILATERATKILHDGDLVEVNGDTGIVTILKRA